MESFNHFLVKYINENLEDHSGEFEVTLPDSDQMDDLLDFEVRKIR